MNVIVKSELKRNGRSYHEGAYAQNDVRRPSLLMSLLPLIALIILIIIGSVFKISQILVLSLVIVIVLEMIMYRSYIKSHIEIINTGTIDALTPLLSTASTIAFGQVVANIGSIAEFTKKIISQSSSKLLIASLITIVFSVITGSGSGAIGIMAPAYGNFLLSSGISAEVIHRVLSISSTVMPNTPHSGVVIALLALSNLSHKESFKHVFLAPAVTGTLALLTALAISSL